MAVEELVEDDDDDDDGDEILDVSGAAVSECVCHPLHQNKCHGIKKVDCGIRYKFLLSSPHSMICSLLMNSNL